jgi:mannose-6-phosphate isomerase-like protein (cupin superfamily)
MKCLGISEVEIVQRKYGIMKLLAGVRSNIMRSKNLDVKILEIEPYRSTSNHYHQRSESVYFVLDGLISADIQGKRFDMIKGDIVLVDVNETHCFTNNSQNICILLEVMSPAYSRDDIFYVD